MCVAFYRGSDSCILVYDVTDEASVDSLGEYWQLILISNLPERWKEDFSNEVELPPGFKFIVVGNKMDQANESSEAIIQKAENFVNSINGIHFQISARDGTGVHELFDTVARHTTKQSQTKETVVLEYNQATTPKSPEDTCQC
eukprot:TRINITY_DN474_c0_g1_i2.p1 TRINITY_DN474_c0_g1~~TRINITY_DN474_c0_g1_i2.p1  ORF type:complete len:143 (-),score=19.02 TRINITY_DN474_c0_g1_i2:208-636(-)